MDNEELLKNFIEVITLFNEYNEEHFKQNYENLNINEVHTIDFIGNNKMPNVKSITRGLGITKGAVTKITTKLENKGYISSYKKEDNKKEKYFNLEYLGEEIFNKHKELHKEAIKSDKLIFDKYNNKEKELIYDFLKELKIDINRKLIK